MKSILKFSLIPLLLHALTSQATLTVTNIAQGSMAIHSLFLKSDGSLWAMGNDQYGELGDARLDNTNRPEQIVSSNVTAIAAGNGHSLFLKSDGSLWAMGLNFYGELGDGTYSRNDPYDGTNQPEQIVASGVTAIAAGEYHSLFLKSGGSLWAMGLNNLGQLGDGTYNNTNQPEQIVASNLTAIAAGNGHSLFLKSDGSLWAMGNGYDGELGDDSFNGANRPEQIIASGVTAIAAGIFDSLFLKSDGSLWVMGDNKYGELGDGFIAPFYPTGTAVPEQIFPLPQPVLSIPLLSQTDLQINATCGIGGNFRLLGSTNLALPLGQWMPISTNSVTARGTNNFSVTLTKAVNPGGWQFYILESQ